MSNKDIYKLFDKDGTLVFQTEDEEEMIDLIRCDSEILKDIENSYLEFFYDRDAFCMEIDYKNDSYKNSKAHFRYYQPDQ